MATNFRDKDNLPRLQGIGDMTDEVDRYGLLACGSSGHWSVDLDESRDGTKWAMQFDGPQVYFAFAVDDPGVVSAALTYLRSGRGALTPLVLGRFGAGSVCLHWDNENSARCFLILTNGTSGAVRFTLSAEDTEMLAAALDQVQIDLQPEVGSVS